MRSSLIISTYNWKKALELCLKSILCQTRMPNEVIIADDGSSVETKELIDNYRTKFSIPLKHVWHEDLGFRVAEIRNKALKVSSEDYIIQIDGDVILHKCFIEDHLKYARKQTFIKSYRAMLTPLETEMRLSNKDISISWLNSGMTSKENAIHIPLLYEMLYQGKLAYDTLGVLGSNMAFWKEDFIKVNGYNNDFKGWGAEDKELAQRFVNIGVAKQKMKFVAIQYHLHHKVRDKKNHDLQISEIKKEASKLLSVCSNGYHQIKEDFKVYE